MTQKNEGMNVEQKIWLDRRQNGNKSDKSKLSFVWFLILFSIGSCVPSQFTTGLQVYPLQIKLYNWPQYCNIFFQKCENIDKAWIWQSSSLCYYWKSILFSIFVASLVSFQENSLFSHCHFLKVDKIDFV